MLRDLFESDKHKVVAVLKERLQLPDEAFPWLMTKIQERKDQPIEYEEAVNYLLSQSDLPNYLVNSLPELIEKGVPFELVTELLGQQSEPSDEVVNCLVELLRSEEHLPVGLESKNQDAFAGPVIKALGQARGSIEATNAVRMLKHTKLDQESVKRLRSLLDTERTTELATFKSTLALHCLLNQVKLDREIILDLHNYIRKKKPVERKMASHVYLVWKHQHIEQFCANLALFDPLIIHQVLEVFLRRSFEKLTPAYIDGNTLYYYAADGKLTGQVLEDEQAFRKKFRQAQRMLKIPEWAWIKLPEGTEDKDPCSTSYSAIFQKDDLLVKPLAWNQGGGWLEPPRKRRRRA